eukprot:5504483-Lingulodinium_polyedra.AAC.1
MVALFVRAVVFADVLRNSKDVLRALEHGIGMVIPPALKPMKNRLDTAAAVVPNKSTVSWR